MQEVQKTEKRKDTRGRVLRTEKASARWQLPVPLE